MGDAQTTENRTEIRIQANSIPLVSSALLPLLGRDCVALQLLSFDLCIVHFFPQSNTDATGKMEICLACFTPLCETQLQLTLWELERESPYPPTINMRRAEM